MEHSSYKPISCSYHDLLESVSVLGKKARIVYEDENGDEIEKIAGFKDVFAKNGEEFLLLDDQSMIRLDRIRLVNLTQFSESCEG